MNTPTTPIDQAIMELLSKVERLLPDEYEMTIFFRHQTGAAASVVFSTDNLPTVVDVLSEKIGVRP